MEDDGAGVDLARLRQALAARGMDRGGLGDDLAEAELLEFLFLPRFSHKETVSHLSGRGVGLDVVRTAVREARGRVSLHNRPGAGFRVTLHLPLSLSVVNALLVTIAGGRYGFPLTRVREVALAPPEAVVTIEGRPCWRQGETPLGLVEAHEVLELPPPPAPREGPLPVVVIGEGEQRFGLVVEALLGQHPLVEQSLESRIGKVQDIASGALTDDGLPVLIVDTDDLLLTIQRRLAEGGLQRIGSAEGGPHHKPRVLVVDDSITVREVQRKLLAGAGYQVEVAVDGMDGWNALRAGKFQLVITDVDMPRMDGIQLVTMIRNNPITQRLPVMIVSYKDREEERRRGMEAGADYYMTKSHFHDGTMLQAVADLIGEGVE